jgi:hypothetical protein
MAYPTRLSEFIEVIMESILKMWEGFARTINPPAINMDEEALRDHAELMLKTMQ